MDLTAVHVKNLFPEPDGITFITENLIWDKIKKQGYKSYYINDALRVYHSESNDSLTSNYRKKKNDQYCLNNLWECWYIINNWEEYPYTYRELAGYILRYSIFYYVLKMRNIDKLKAYDFKINNGILRAIMAIITVPSIIGAKLYIKRKM